MKRQNRSGRITLQNRTGRTGLVVATAAAMAWASQQSRAANLNWDPGLTNGATGGGAGTWDANDLANWFNGAADQQWTDISPLGTDTAIFGGSTGGAVSITSNLSAAELIFTTAGYNLSSVDTLTLGANASSIGLDASALTSGTTTLGTVISLAAVQSWNVGGGSTLIDSGSNTGAGNLTKIGTGALTLSGNNSAYTGNTTLTAGVLNVNNNNAFGSGTFTVNGGSLLDSTTSGIVVAGNAVHWNGNFTFVGTNSLNLGTGTVTMGGGTPPITRSIVVKANTLTIGGQLTDAAVGDSLLKEGVGTLALTNGTNSYANTTISGGTIALSSAGVLGSTTGTLTLGNGELNFTGSRTLTTGVLADNAGLNTITLSPSGGTPLFSAASLGTRAGGAVEIYRGVGGASTVTFAASPTPSLNSLTGPYGAYSSTGTGTGTQLPVLRGALVDSSATGEGTGFATYGASGVTLLTGQLTANTTTAFAASSTGDNVLISNPGATLTIAGKQINTLQINNTSGSLTTITPSGTLNASNGLLFTGSSAVTLASGTTINVTDTSNTEDSIILSTNTAGVTIASAINSSGGATNVGNVTFGGLGNFNITGALTTKSNGGVFFDGPGTVTLASATNMSSAGVQILGGTVKLATGFTYSTARALHIASGAVLDMGGVSPSNLDFLVDVNGAGGTITNSSANVSNLTIVNTSTVSNVQTFSGAITGNINYAQTLGTPGTTLGLVQVLSGQSSYSGSTTLNSGTIRLGINNALPITTPLTVNGNGNAQIATFFDLAGFNQTVGSLAGNTTAGTPTIINSLASSTSTLTVNGTANTAYAGVIADNAGTGGVMALTRGGTGVLTLSGVNTYSGGTTINGGMLKANNATGSTGSGFVIVNNGGTLAGGGSTGSGTLAGPVTVNSGGHLDPGDTAGLGASFTTLTIGPVAASSASLTLSGGSILDFNDSNNSGTDEIVVNGALTFNASSGNQIGINILSAGGKFQPTLAAGTITYPLIHYTGTALSAGVLTSDLKILNPIGADTYSFTPATDAGGNLVDLTITFPPPKTWLGTTSGWEIGTNWNPTGAPNLAGTAVILPAVSNTLINLDGNKIIGSMTFTGGSYSIQPGSGGTLTIDNSNISGTGAITSSSGTSHIINVPLSLAGPTLVTTSSSSDKITISGGISGNGGLTAAGSGVLALTGNNSSFLGGVTIAGGTVQINSANSLGSASIPAVINAGTLEVTGGNFAEARNFQFGSTTSAIQIDSGTYEIDGNITDVNSVSQKGTLNLNPAGGSGTLIFTGTSSNVGGMNISGTGVLQLGNTAGTVGATLGGGTVTIASGGILNVGSASPGLASGTTVTISSELAGTGALNQNGTGTLTLSGSNANYSGNVTINGTNTGTVIAPIINGTLNLGSATSTTATGIGNLTLNNVNVSTSLATAQIGFNGTTTSTAALSPTMTFSGAVGINTGTGTLTIAEQFTGGVAGSPVTINRNAGTGTLVLGLAGNTALGVTAPFGNALFANFTNSVGSVTFAARGAGSGNATYNLTAPTGTVTVNGSTGTINFGALNGTMPIGATAVSRLGIGGLNTNSTYSGVIGSANPTQIGVSKNGTGTLTLSGQNTYSGPAQTNAGGAATAVAWAGTAVTSGTLIAGSTAAGDGSFGAFGATNTATPNYILIGNVTNLNNASLLADASQVAGAAITVANPIVASGGGTTATTTAYTLSLGGAATGAATFSGGVTLENNATISQATGGTVILTGGITGTDGDTGPDSTTVISHGFTGAGNGLSANNSGFQILTFNGPGSMVVSGANNTTPGFAGLGIFDTNDPTLSNANNLPINGTNPQIYKGGNGIISVSVTGGTTTFASVNQYTGGTSVSGGTLILGNLAPALSARSVAGLNVSGGTVQVAPASTHANRNVLVLSSGYSIPAAPIATPNVVTPAIAPPLTLSGTGTIDLTNNDMIVHSGSNGIAQLQALNAAANTGLNAPGGTWTGTGLITSSGTKANNPNTNTGLAIVVNDTHQSGTLSGTPLLAAASPINNGLTTFDGQTVADGDVLVKYTYFGDALLTGKVIAADYTQIDTGFASGGTLQGWFNGDFNYDGKINGDDYSLIDNAFNTQGSVSLAGISAGPAEMIASNTSQIAGASVSAVPEPTTLGMLGIGAAGLLTRRRRRNA